MKKIILSSLTMVLGLFCTFSLSAQSDLVITGVFDGPLSGGVPKGVELYVLNDITDLSIYGIGSANNGGGSDGQEFTFPTVAATAGDFLYVASESAQFAAFFGFIPDYTNGAAGINGDDALELFKDGMVVDVFGEIDTDGNGEPWEYLDGWASRVDATGPEGTTFTLTNWTYSGANAWDGETLNATATSPMPIASYVPPSTSTAIKINEIRIDQSGTDNDEYFEIMGAPGTSLDGISLLVIGDDGSGGSGVIEHITTFSASDVIPADGHYLIAESSFTLATPDLVTLLNFENSDNVTFLLVEGFTGASMDDVDDNNDCSFNATLPWTSILCEVSLVETPNSGDCIYSSVTVGPDGSFVPGHVYLNEAGWQIGEFSSFEDDTPGTMNPAPPVDCELSNLSITSMTCNGDDVMVVGEFTVANGSGSYTLTIGSATLAITGATDGQVSISGTLAASGGEATITVVDDEDAMCSIELADQIIPTCPTPADCSDLFIELVVDGDLTGGLPKVIKLCADDDIADLGLYGLGAANNGGGSDGIEFQGMSGELKAGQCVFLTSGNSNGAAAFEIYFGFPADYVIDGSNSSNGGPTAINGDDAIELFCNGSIVDVYGDPTVNGDFESWDYTDSWAYRNTPGQNGGTFDPATWTFGGRGALEDLLRADEANPLIPCIPIVEVTDPCMCGNPQNLIVTGGITARFHEVVQVTLTPDPGMTETWVLESTDMAKPIYSTKTGDAVSSITMVPQGGGVYQAEFWHDADVGYEGVVTNGLLTNPIEVSNSCTSDCPLIPTMGQWGLFILGLLMTNLGLVFMYNERKQVA